MALSALPVNRSTSPSARPAATGPVGTPTSSRAGAAPAAPSTGASSFETATPAAASNPLLPKTPFRRHPLVAVSKFMMAEVAKDGTAATMTLHEEANGLTKWSFPYHTGRAKEANLAYPPPTNMLNLTVVMNVSGHSGEADKFAADPKQAWVIEVVTPDKKSQRLRVPRPTSTGKVYSVAQDISFDISQHGTYLVRGWPEGSAGVGGYREGREYKLHVGRENFYSPWNDLREVAKAAGATLAAMFTGDERKPNSKRAPFPMKEL